MTQVVEAPGPLRLAGSEPLFARLPAFPSARREAEDLYLYAAALQRARQDIGAAGGDHDRPAAHRAGVVEQKRHDRIAELHVPLALERQRVHGIDDDARQARRIERAFLEVEVPGAVLLREQAPLQPVGEARDGARQCAQLPVEVGAQALELLGRGQLLGADLLVELAGEHLVAEGFRVIEDRGVGAPWLRRLELLEVVEHALELIGARRLGSFLRLVDVALGLTILALLVAAVLAVLGRFRLAVAAFLFVVFIARHSHRGQPARCPR